MREQSVVPAISVVMPCFNLGHFLQEALDSVLCQSMQDFEIIIVDDGSTDENTLAVLRKLDIPRVQVFHQANCGLPFARNNGIRLSSGRYICCLDPDDRLARDFFQTAFDILESQSDVGLVSGYFQTFGDRLYEQKVSFCRFPEILAFNPMVEPSIFRRKVWSQVGGYCETFSASGIEDWDLWISILEAGYKGYIIPEIVWYYRTHANQMSRSMYKPDTWRRLNEELVQRHRSAYDQYLAGVIGELNVRWVEIMDWANNREDARAWWESQSIAFQNIADERERIIQSTMQRIVELERAGDWWKEQVENHRRLVNEHEQVIAQQKQWIVQVEDTKTWWEEQAKTWQDLAGKCEQTIAEQKQWIAELERARDWANKECMRWKEISETLSPDKKEDHDGRSG